MHFAPTHPRRLANTIGAHGRSRQDARRVRPTFAWSRRHGPSSRRPSTLATCPRQGLSANRRALRTDRHVNLFYCLRDGLTAFLCGLYSEARPMDSRLSRRHFGAVIGVCGIVMPAIAAEVALRQTVAGGILLPVSVNGVSLTFVLDTGAERTLIARRAFATLPGMPGLR